MFLRDKCNAFGQFYQVMCNFVIIKPISFNAKKSLVTNINAAKVSFFFLLAKEKI